MVTPNYQTSAPTLYELSRAKRWLADKALPLWLDAGLDKTTGRFQERLDFDGTPIINVPLRLMVQCRQIYVYSKAHLLRWLDVGSLVERSLDKMINGYFEADGCPGWVFSINVDGSIADPRRDLYSHAFVLLALGAVYRLTGSPRILKVVNTTYNYLDRKLRSTYGGYLEGFPSICSVRRQNPHMHLFEAALELSEATGGQSYASRSMELFDLLNTALFRHELGAIPEFFEANWDLKRNAPIICEPGHHFEWIWLLRKFARLTRHPVESIVEKIYTFAISRGLSSSGQVLNEVTPNGSIIDADTRVWPQTEATKAIAIEHISGRPDCLPRLGHFLKILQEHYLTTRVEGGWIDRLDQNGCPAIDFIPASSFYHIACSVWEAQSAFVNC